MSEATTTLDGWYCLHDLRSIDWPHGKHYLATNADKQCLNF